MSETREIKAYLETYKADIMQFTEEKKDVKMPVLTEELFSLFERTGNRLEYENAYFLRREYLSAFAMRALFTQEFADIKKLEEIIVEICDEICWALPAHVDREKDSQWHVYIDLFASETAQSLAEITCVLDSLLSTKVKERVREEVFKRVLTPFYSTPAPYSHWEHCHHNWCAVCCGSIGCASICFMADQPEMLNSCLHRICDSLTYYIEGFGDDGGCEEALSYFIYGMTYYTAFARMLFDYSHGEIDLMESRKCQRIAEFQQKCFFTGGRTLSFSDGSSSGYFKMGLTSFLSMRYETVRIPDMKCVNFFTSDICFRWAAIYRDYFWTKEYLEGITSGYYKNRLYTGEILAEHMSLPDLQWSIAKSKNGIGMAVKGGHNAESHNHNDIGHFVYAAGMDMLLTDLGAGEYTKEYFSEGRYDILCNHSFGHSVPIINGEGQKQGREYTCDYFKTDGNGKTIVSFHGAYEKNRLKSLIRVLTFDMESGDLVIDDQIETTESTQCIIETLVTQIEPKIYGNLIVLEGIQYNGFVEIEGVTGKIEVECKTHSNHEGEEESVYLIRWQIPTQVKSYCRIKVSACTLSQTIM